MGSSNRARPEGPRLSPEGRMRYERKFPYVLPHDWADSHVFLTRPPLATHRASSAVLPFDLHVLGLPPAFSEPGSNSSLKTACPKANCFRCRARPTPLLAVRVLAYEYFEIDGVDRTSADGQLPPPDARTSHLRTLSKICERRPQRLVRFSPRRFRRSEPHIIQGFLLPSTPCLELFAAVQSSGQAVR